MAVEMAVKSPKGFADGAAAFVGADGDVSLEEVAESFGVTKAQLGAIAGLSRDTLYRRDRLAAPRTQARLRDVLEILARVTDWAGGRYQAMAWYRATPLAGFGDRTAESLVKDGRADAVRDYLDAVALGGFA